MALVHGLCDLCRNYGRRAHLFIARPVGLSSPWIPTRLLPRICAAIRRQGHSGCRANSSLHLLGVLIAVRHGSHGVKLQQESSRQPRRKAFPQTALGLRYQCGFVGGPIPKQPKGSLRATQKEPGVGQCKSKAKCSSLFSAVSERSSRCLRVRKSKRRHHMRQAPTSSFKSTTCKSHLRLT